MSETDHTDESGSPDGDHAQDTELVDSNPNAGGPERAAGGMGVSSERVGPTGPGQESTDGERDTRAPREVDHAGDVIGAKAGTPQSSAGEPEANPDPPIPPKAGYPSKNPRSEDHPYKDA